jgi:hypothetical protein
MKISWTMVEAWITTVARIARAPPLCMIRTFARADWRDGRAAITGMRVYLYRARTCPIITSTFHTHPSWSGGFSKGKSARAEAYLRNVLSRNRIQWFSCLQLLQQDHSSIICDEMDREARRYTRNATARFYLAWKRGRISSSHPISLAIPRVLYTKCE